jgi:hypothetical protein
MMERDQPHKTPVTSTWTGDFLTREGEGHKTMGEWLRDKTISWKTHRRFLQTNAGTFPCESRLQKNGVTIQIIYAACASVVGRWTLSFLVTDPPEVPPAHSVRRVVLCHVVASVREKDWLETFKLFGIGKEEGRKIIHKLGYTLLSAQRT